jgi:hypothetical protein
MRGRPAGAYTGWKEVLSMKNLIIGLAFAAALAAAGPAEAATTIVPKPASPPAVSSGTAAGGPAASGSVGVTPSSAPAAGAANPGAAPNGANNPACAGDLAAYCSNPKPGETVDQCLDRNASRLSTGCRMSRSSR